MLVQCLYASRSVEPITESTLASVLAASRRNNPSAGITGILCHTDGIFMQILEGGRDEVSNLLVKIMQDERHRNVTLLVFDEIQERAFADWSMGQASIDKINPGHLLRYSAHQKLNPFVGPGRTMLSMILDMRANGGIIAK